MLSLVTGVAEIANALFTSVVGWVNYALVYPVPTPGTLF